MQLCDKEIIRAIAEGYLVFASPDAKRPFLRDQIQPGSIDLRLGRRIVRFKKEVTLFDIKNIDTIRDLLDISYMNEGEPIRIEPGEIVFGEIYEQIYISDKYSARIEGRSRVARLGLSIHCTGDYINPGFEGSMPLQIINHNSFPIILYPYIDICQMIVYQLTDTPLIPYKDRPESIYHKEEHASPSVLSANNTDSSHTNISKESIRLLLEKYYQQMLRESSVSEESINKKIENATKSGVSATVNITNNIANKNEDKVDVDVSQNLIVDFAKVSEELNIIKSNLNNLPQNPDNIIILGDATKIEKAVNQKDNTKFWEALKTCGKEILKFARDLGCAVLADYICLVMGIK